MTHQDNNFVIAELKNTIFLRFCVIEILTKF